MTRKPIPISSIADAHDDRERRDALGEERGVQRGAQCRRGDPRLTRGVGDGLAGLRVDRGGLLIAGGLAGGVQEATHLRVDLAARGLERVLADAGGEQLRVGAGVDGLVGDGRVHVRRADDLLSLSVSRTSERPLTPV